MSPKKKTAPGPPSNADLIFPLIIGFFFFITIIKFGSPVIIQYSVVQGNVVLDAPQDFVSAIFDIWPTNWAPWLFVPVALVGVFAIALDRVKLHWALALPLIWLVWEFVSAAQTVNPALTKITLTHFTVCVCFFYLGFFARTGMANPWAVWAGMGLALCWAMRTGIEQHFGGLEATRKMMAESPGLSGMSAKMLSNPEYLKRLASNRIFGTFGGYANSLAGGLVLLLPLTLVFVWNLTPKVRTRIRVLFLLILGGCGLGCLYWSGSKAGWLVALVVGLVALGHSPLPLKWRRWVIYGVLVLGVAGFAYKYAGFFHKERNSVGARFTYWRAALTVVRQHPLLGTGPGTFQIPFAQLKNPTDEMARLCHNDYLEQASDSGLLGFISYTAMVITFLAILYRYSIQKPPFRWLNFAIWLGIFGLCLHSLVEFHLYVPALAWPMFFLCGWLMSRYNYR
jgi:O-antigen ligase